LAPVADATADFQAGLERWRCKLVIIGRVAVLGAGTMGPGIAQTFAQHGYEVGFFTRRQETMDRAMGVIQTNLELFVAKGLLTQAEQAPLLGRLHPTLSVAEAVAGADLIVETIAEKRDLKRELFQQLDELCDPEVIFTSNTSSLNVYELSPRPATTVIAHWFAPPHILPLIEVVRGPETSDETLETVVALMKRIGKTPVVLKKFVAGFLINRLLRAIGREMFYLLDNGFVTAEELDLAVKASIAPRMVVLGIVQRYDFTGLDISARNLENPDFPDPPIDNHPKSLFELVEAGQLGVKTGKGFFDYGGRPLKEILRDRDERLLDIFRATESFLK
jgi:3-hydroxybutyryl-CoA dehydrogenase